MQQNDLWFLHKIVPHRHLSVLFPEFNLGMRLDLFLSILHAFHGQEMSHERHWELYLKRCLCYKLGQVITTIVDVNSSVSSPIWCSYGNVWKGEEERRGGRREQ